SWPTPARSGTWTRRTPSRPNCLTGPRRSRPTPPRWPTPSILPRRRDSTARR
ncbi:MAG: hypothetical protein AVDCRST_MAG70-2200, partial [uncultured Thermomicrobiales bacterium]